jgi:hypothetical protein
VLRRSAVDLGVRLYRDSNAIAAIRRGADALDRELGYEAELEVSEIGTSAAVLGAFQRGHSAPAGALTRRISGGPLIDLGPGTLHVLLALRTPSALTRSDGAKLINRYVRPLLRALTKGGATAHYFGRDWISVLHRPAAAVGFAHDATSGRAAFEAFVAVRAPLYATFAPPLHPRPAFLGKDPGTLETIVGRPFETNVLAQLVVDAYVELAGGEARELTERSPMAQAEGERALRAEPPWAACVDEAIGAVCAGVDSKGLVRLGGDFMASRDAVTRVESEVAGLGASPSARDVSAIVNEAFAPPAATLGVRDFGSVARVLLAATLQNRA